MTADFVPATWRAGETHSSSLIRAIPTIIWKHKCHPQNRKYITYRIAVRGGPCHDHSNMEGKFGEIWTCDFWDMQSDRRTDKQMTLRQTDRQTRWSQYLAPYCGRSTQCKHSHCVSGMIQLRISTDGEMGWKSRRLRDMSKCDTVDCSNIWKSLQLL